MSDYTTVSANGLPAVNELIKFAVRDINDALEKADAIFRLNIESYRVIKIVPTHDSYLIKAVMELNLKGQALIILCFKRYGLIPIFYSDSIGVEIDND